MRTRLVVGGLGVLLVGFGVVSVLLHLITRLPQLALWLVVPLVVHDGLLVPATLALAWLGRKALPRAWWGPAVVLLTLAGTLVALVLPALLSPATGSVPGLLNRDYPAGLGIAIAVTWTLTIAACLAVRALRRRPGRDRDDARA
jgi:hypothetical protein